MVSYSIFEFINFYYLVIIMKRVEISLLVAVILSAIFSNVLIFDSEYNKLKSNIVRVHILANSNSASDQLLKYKIKDDIYCYVSGMLKNAKNKCEAKRIINDNLDNILKISKQKIKDNNFNYDVNVALTKSYFPTRRYDGFVLPAGNYDALKVIIGKGDGQNWWCVAFPPMCSPVDCDDEKISEILGEEQIDMIKKPCEYKFAILEFIEEIKQKIKK